MSSDERSENEEEIGSLIEYDEPVQPMVLNVYNVLASAHTGVNIDLDWFTLNFGNTYYDPQEFPAARVDVHDKYSNLIITVSVFSNGKIQATGASTVELTKKSLKKIVKKMIERGYVKAKLLNFEVHNIQGVIDAGFPVDLRILRDLYEYVDYEPERNPGLKIRIPVLYINDQDVNPEYLQRKLLSHLYNDAGNRIRNKSTRSRGNSKDKIEIVTLTIHFSGKIGMAGAKTVKSLEDVLMYIKPYLIRSKLV
ncbi:hypothetical protein FG386_001887 [Cryptosporidium ryanae]|uniref:uncharacterized protein n=1 Tax=Cryptosporidium ryanae TaxID=515981 RepID=UPI00351A8CAF|nr:hypothetical protein FG386_001887 [Cryptosporidium ryanae]